MKKILVLFKKDNMKKLMLILAVVTTNSFAQISLKDDSITYKNETPSKGVLSTEKFQELNGFTKYTATIQGFSGFCKFSEDYQKVFYNNFIQKITNLKLSKEENEIINNSFKQVAYDIKKNGIEGLTCDKFKPDFEKIIKEISPN